MIRPLLPAILLSLALAGPGHARDERLVERLFSPDEVVVIEGRTQIQATIQFADDERIENVAIGDSTSWQVTPNKRANLLFVKPLEPRAVTNMTVVTDRHTYLFDLVASPAAQPLYVLRFTYPEMPGEDADEPTRLADAANTLEMQAATDPYAVLDPAALNHAWRGTGDSILLPADMFDDGESTFLSWAPGAPIPAILIKNDEGTEGPVNYAVRGDTIVVDGVPAEIVLRAGDDEALLTNEGPVRSAAVAQSDAAARNGEFN